MVPKTWKALLVLSLISFIGLSTPVAAERVIYAFDKDFPPFTYLESGKPTGFEVQLLKAIATESGFNIVLKPMLWKEAQKALSEGKADVISGIARTEQRLKIYDFSEPPHANMNVRIFVKEGSDIRSILCLKGRKVATQKGSLYHTLLLKVAGIDMVLFSTETEALEALALDEVDAFVGGDTMAYYYMRKRDLKGIKGIGTPIRVISLHYAIKKGNQKLLSLLEGGMRRVKEKGEYDKIYRKWFVKELSRGEIQALLNASRAAMTNAYAPYSNFQVGAAVLTRSGKIYTGCNIENALYGLTVSALKVALFKAVSEGDVEIRGVANLMPDGTCSAPAADERQILYEFGKGILTVMGKKGEYKTKIISELLPYPFEIRK